jgi:predicted metal-dependent hydrolase
LPRKAARLNARLGALLGALSGTAQATLPSRLPGPHGPLPLVVRTNARARRMTLRLCASSRTVKLTVPPRTPLRHAVAFLHGQQGWLETQARLRLPPPIRFEPGAVLPLGDGELLLLPGSGRSALRQGDRLLVPGADALFEGRVRRWLLAEAQRLLEPETRALAERIGRPVRQVKVGTYHSRWGSCAADGRIAYNWRLVLAPGHVRRSVVAHEVAHLAVPNHSPAFWDLATELLGRSHREARSWLRANGPLLHSIGAQ